LFCAWYACNFAYSITNKEALGLWPFPFSFGAIQLFVGLVYVSILWSPLPLYNRRSGWRSTTLRARPSFTRAHVREMLPAAALLAIGHTAATAAPAYGSVAFTNVVKTTETLFASVCLALVSREIFNPSMLFKSSSFNVPRLKYALRLLNHAPYKQDGAPSLYSALTIISFALLVPVSLLVEGPSIHAWWTQSSAAALAASGGLSSNPLSGRLVRLLTLTGLFNYLSNELAFCVLDLCSPLTYAVANTVKRVIVIVGSVLFFKTRVTPIGSLGASMAICGAFLYSLA
ncbi:triose-phosphate transporter family-domain-containing protein, partial [Pavlovales sp. CCMP2436]